MKFWAIIRVYEPFRLGSVWNWYKYQINAEPCKVAGYDCFIYHDSHRNKWIVHETTTGGFLAASETKERALGRAKYDIERTPDFSKQCHQLLDIVGENHCNLPEKDTEEILLMLSKDDCDPDKEDLKDMADTRILEL